MVQGRSTPAGRRARGFSGLGIRGATQLSATRTTEGPSTAFFEPRREGGRNAVAV